jgi:CheY-like chemotaxis protein
MYFDRTFPKRSDLKTQSEAFEILLAEDNPADVTLVGEALERQRLSYNLYVMKDGAEAIAFLEARDTPGKPQIDLLLLDMYLPKFDGEEILRRLRSTEQNAQTPVIVMTVSTDPRDIDAARRHAAMHYFMKPSNLQEFMQLGVLAREILEGRKFVFGETCQEAEQRGVF